MICVAFNYNTARKFAKLSITLRVLLNTVNQPIYAHFQDLCSREEGVNGVNRLATKGEKYY